MNKAIKKLWIDALRSGEYKQGTGRLSTVDEAGITRMCCLGVLCDLYIKRTGKGVWRKDDDSELRCFIYSYGTSSSLPPREVVKWAGLDTDRGMKGINLDSMNDGIGQPRHSYAEIANVIEEKF